MIHRPIANPQSPYSSQHAEWLEPPPVARLEIFEEVSGSVLTKNDSPDIPFTWSVNPYRGCQHACAYCYARPYHEYLDLGCGHRLRNQAFRQDQLARAAPQGIFEEKLEPRVGHVFRHHRLLPADRGQLRADPGVPESLH